MQQLAAQLVSLDLWILPAEAPIVLTPMDDNIEQRRRLYFMQLAIQQVPEILGREHMQMHMQPMSTHVCHVHAYHTGAAGHGSE